MQRKARTPQQGRFPKAVSPASRVPKTVKYGVEDVAQNKEGVGGKRLTYTDENGKTRYQFVDRRRATAGEVEHRRHQVYLMTLRGIPRTVQAELLGVSIFTIEGDVAENKQRMKREVYEMDFPLFIAETLCFYKEMRSSALNIAFDDANKKDNKSRLGAMQLALQAEKDKHAFLEAAGFYKAVRDAESAKELPMLNRETTDDQDFNSLVTVLNNQITGG